MITKNNPPGGESQGADKSLAGSLSSLPPGYLVGIDGRLHPARLHDANTRAYFHERCHQLRHDHGLTYRQIIAAFADEGLKISFGSVSNLLRRPCASCSGGDQR
jgi:hypothetical protein